MGNIDMLLWATILMTIYIPLQLSFGSSSPILSDTSRFPNFFRLAVPDQKHAAARIDLLEKYNWKKVATIHQALEFFSVVGLVFDFVICSNLTKATIGEIRGGESKCFRWGPIAKRTPHSVGRLSLAHAQRSLSSLLYSDRLWRTHWPRHQPPHSSPFYLIRPHPTLILNLPPFQYVPV